jgi:hypothetical protein
LTAGERAEGAARAGGIAAAQGGVEIETLAGAMDDLARRGFTEHFVLVNGRLRGVESGGSFLAAEMVIAEHHRFEGVSDPDDMSIVYAIETSSGIRGTLADAFGVYADPGVGAFMQDVARSHA